MDERKEKETKIRQGKQTVKNLFDRKLSDSDYILLGKGLKFCPKPKSHDKIKLAEETFNYTRRLRLKEYFYENITKKEEDSESNMYKQMPFFNKKNQHLSRQVAEILTWISTLWQLHKNSPIQSKTYSLQ